MHSRVIQYHVKRGDDLGLLKTGDIATAFLLCADPDRPRVGMIFFPPDLVYLEASTGEIKKDRGCGFVSLGSFNKKKGYWEKMKNSTNDHYVNLDRVSRKAFQFLL